MSKSGAGWVRLAAHRGASLQLKVWCGKMSGHLLICTRVKERPPLGTSGRWQVAWETNKRQIKAGSNVWKWRFLTWLAWADLDGANLKSSAGDGFKFKASAAAPAEEEQQHLGQERQSPDVFWHHGVMFRGLVRLWPRALPIQRQKYCNVCLLSPLQDLFRCLSWKKKGRMFHTPIDQGGGGAPLLFFFFLFPTQCADSSPPPGDKIRTRRGHPF